MSASEDDEMDDYESDFIDDDDDDDEDYGTSRKKNKQKGKKGSKKNKKQKTGAYFLEEEAAEDSDEESDDDVEVTENEKRLAMEERRRIQNELKRKHHATPAFLNLENDEDLPEYFRNVEQMQEAGEDNELALLPSAGDPKLFAVKCKPTEEREACLQVMKKYFECLNTPHEFQIFSVTSVDKTQGYIYVEAHSNKHVFMAVANIPIIYGSNVLLVSFTDRTQIFESDPTKSIQVKVGQWVRVNKRGIYDGDLGQVVDSNDAKGTVTVKLVPRLLPPNEDDQVDDDDDDKDEEAKRQKKIENMRKARSAVSGIRPPQKLFNENDFPSAAHDRDSERATSYYVYQKNRYYDGFLHKKMPIKNLLLNDLNVTYDETKFFTNAEDADVGQLSALVAQGGNRPTKFFKGDRVKVTKGDLMNLEGEIVKIGATSLSVKPTMSDYADLVEIQPSDCVKSFKKGDYVRVVDGKNAGKEGFVLSVEDESIATIMSDGLKNMIQVFVNDLVYCNDSTRNIDVSSSKEKDKEQEFVKFDLVKLNDRKTVGIVLGTANMGWKILDNFGNVRSVTTYQIEEKLQTRNKMTRNDKSQTFKTGDSIRILQGKYKGQTGTIRHIYNDILFIYNPDVPHNMGVIIEKPNNCFLLSTQNASGKPAGPKAKDSLVGQKCTIKSGPWKGYQGIVREGNEKTVRLELSAKCQIIDVKRELVMPSSEIGKNTNEPTTEGRNLEPKTPMINRFPQSPYFNMNSPGFEASPAWGGFESPAYNEKI